MKRSTFLKVFTSLFTLPKIMSVTPQPSNQKSSVTGGGSESSLTPPSPSVDLSLLLDCIAQVETNRNDRAVGKAGELSQYQISPDVWYQHRPNLNFFLACNGIRAQDCAMEHLMWLDKHIPRESPIEKDFREFALAWCWNAGMLIWKNKNLYITTKVNNYAVRVTNLYTDVRRSSSRP